MFDWVFPHTLPLIVLLPFIGAAVIAVSGRKNGRLRDCIAICTAFFAFILSISLYPLVVTGQVVYELPSLMGQGLMFRADFLGFVFAVLASFIWLVATVYSSHYMRQQRANSRYYIFLLLSLGGCLGVFVAGDFLSLFLFFEAMTLAAYVLVVHSESEDALAAGRKYLYMGIFGGLCLLVTILLLAMHTGTTVITPNMERLADLGIMRWVLALLFFIGFGIKAGAVPLHIWLPLAHPVAPTPASALLSAIMIKTGAYGIIRVFNLLFTPTDEHSLLWQTTAQFGLWLIWIGVITMFVAAVLALVQQQAKRLLAYSSVSQMGYILMGIGSAAYLGFDGAMGFASFSYHLLNHAFFKAGMFLMVGSIYLRTHTLDYAKLGGLWRKFPITALAFLMAGAAISGVPGFNGYVSKTLLHHAIVSAWEQQYLVSLWWAEKVFVLTGGLTFCYILRLFVTLFLGREKENSHDYQSETLLERLIFVAFAGIILYGGLAYAQVIERVVLPMAAGFSYDAYGLNYVAKSNVWNAQDLGGIAISLGIGAAAFALLSRIGFNLPLPKQLSIEQLLYKPVLNFLLGAFMTIGRMLEAATESVLLGSVRPLAQLAGKTGNFDDSLLPGIGRSILAALLFAREQSYEFVVSKVSEVARYIQQAEWIAFFTLIKIDYNPRGDELYKRLTLMNLDLCLFIVIVTLVIIFSLRFLTLTPF